MCWLNVEMKINFSSPQCARHSTNSIRSFRIEIVFRGVRISVARANQSKCQKIIKTGKCAQKWCLCEISRDYFAFRSFFFPLSLSLSSSFGVSFVSYGMLSYDGMCACVVCAVYGFFLNTRLLALRLDKNSIVYDCDVDVKKMIEWNWRVATRDCVCVRGYVCACCSCIFIRIYFTRWFKRTREKKWINFFHVWSYWSTLVCVSQSVII